MENETRPGVFESMPCESTKKTIAELEEEGWECDWSFHSTFIEQWNEACKRVKGMKDDGLWEPILVLGQNEAERKDGVEYIYKKRTEKYRKYEKEMGYSGQ